MFNHYTSKLVRYQVIRSNGKPYGFSILVPLSKVLEDCNTAMKRGILFTLDYVWNGHEGMFVHQQIDPTVFSPDPKDRS